MSFSNMLYGDVRNMKPQWQYQNATMRDPKELAKEYGITYEYGDIKGYFDESSREAYRVKELEMKRAENAYAANMFNTQMSSIDAIRKSNSQAIATGASRGFQGANELSAILGLQQESVAGATQLASDRVIAAEQLNADLAKNGISALQMANQAAQGLLTANTNIYNADIQQNVGKAQYYAALDTALKQLMGAQEQSAANRYSADKNYQAAVDAANIQAAATRAAASSYGGGGYGGSSGGEYDIDEFSNTSSYYVKNKDWQSFYAYQHQHGFSDAQIQQNWKGLYGQYHKKASTPSKPKQNKPVNNGNLFSNNNTAMNIMNPNYRP